MSLLIYFAKNLQSPIHFSSSYLMSTSKTHQRNALNCLSNPGMITAGSWSLRKVHCKSIFLVCTGLVLDQITTGLQLVTEGISCTVTTSVSQVMKIPSVGFGEVQLGQSTIEDETFTLMHCTLGSSYHKVVGW